jgi:hypothetical protein
MVGCGLDSCGSEYGPVVGTCEHGNESSTAIKDWEFLDYLRNLCVCKSYSKGNSSLKRCV